MAGGQLSPKEFEDAVGGLFTSVNLESASDALEEAFFDKLRLILARAGKKEWSLRPRIYTVLRLINRIDAMHALVMEGCLDFHFPFSDMSVPAPLNVSSIKFRFLDTQRLVLSKAVSFEDGGGRHKHIGSDADTHFKIINSLLGRGGFGVVDHVQSKLSLNEFARKRILRARTFARDKAAVKIFENELRNLRRLKHPHLVGLVGSYTDPRFVGILMSPIADTNLKEFLETMADSPIPNRKPLLRQFFGCLSNGLAYLHSQKCRHKDIKPSNILVKGDKVLYTDFGTARDWSDRTHGTTVGPTGAFTPAYASPEVADQAPRSGPADVWSLGCVFLDMIAVLKGDSLQKKQAFFEAHGTGLPWPRTNPDGLIEYLNHLEVLTQVDNEPISWIQHMLRDAPRQRIATSELFSKIQSLDKDVCYYGDCCFPDLHSTDQSEAESIYDDETLIEKHQSPLSGAGFDSDKYLNNTRHGHQPKVNEWPVWFDHLPSYSPDPAMHKDEDEYFLWIHKRIGKAEELIRDGRHALAINILKGTLIDLLQSRPNHGTMYLRNVLLLFHASQDADLHEAASEWAVVAVEYDSTNNHALECLIGCNLYKTNSTRKIAALQRALRLAPRTIVPTLRRELEETKINRLREHWSLPNGIISTEPDPNGSPIIEAAAKSSDNVDYCSDSLTSRSSVTSYDERNYPVPYTSERKDATAGRPKIPKRKSSKVFSENGDISCKVESKVAQSSPPISKVYKKPSRTVVNRSNTHSAPLSSDTYMKVSRKDSKSPEEFYRRERTGGEHSRRIESASSISQSFLRGFPTPRVSYKSHKGEASGADTVRKKRRSMSHSPPRTQEPAKSTTQRATVTRAFINDIKQGLIKGYIEGWRIYNEKTRRGQ